MNNLTKFINHLTVLKFANFETAFNDEIYRMGIFVQFNLTFELAWKALQEVLRLHGANAETGSPREILQLGYKMGFINDSTAWLSMLKTRNTAVHIYDEDEIDKVLLLIRDSYIKTLQNLAATLKEKCQNIETL